MADARTILITGSASGIGAATAARLAGKGARIIGADLRDADIIVDLATPDGRARLAGEAERLAPEGLDGVLAGAGIANPDAPAATIAINYFGAVATLASLRPLLARSVRPRAAAICSCASLGPSRGPVIDACLGGEEAAAQQLAAQPGGSAYCDAKRALSLWVRAKATTPEWIGSGILLNAVSPGLTVTAMTSAGLGDPAMRDLMMKGSPSLVEGHAAPEEMAEALDFLLNLETKRMVGQILYVDGGCDALWRPTTI